MNYYSYEELSQKALAAGASQADVDALGEWFQQYGEKYWTGECFQIDADNSLFPIYTQIGEDEFEITGYEIR